MMSMFWADPWVNEAALDMSTIQDYGNCGLTRVNRAEGGLLAVVEAGSKFNLGNGAATEIFATCASGRRSGSGRFLLGGRGWGCLFVISRGDLLVLSRRGRGRGAKQSVLDECVPKHGAWDKLTCFRLRRRGQCSPGSLAAPCSRWQDQRTSRRWQDLLGIASVGWSIRDIQCILPCA